MLPQNLASKSNSASFAKTTRLIRRPSAALFLRVGAVLVFTGMLLTVFYSPSSASLSRGLDNRALSVASLDNAQSTLPTRQLAERAMPSAMPSSSEAFNSVLAPVPQSSSETLATYASNCTTPQSNFVVGETVCVVATGVPLSPFDVFRRRLTWATTDSSVVRSTEITSDPQSDSLLITPTSLSNGQTIDNRGTWQVAVKNPFFFYNEAIVRFTVTDPVRPTADVAVDTLSSPSTVGAGSQANFELQVTNYGPDSSTNVTLTDAVPANTTFASFIQSSGPAFTCTSPAAGETGTTTCKIATLTSGAVARFVATYDVSSGAANGTQIVNTADVASVASVTPPVPATDDENLKNNSTSSTVTVIAGGGGGTCTLTCPEDINAVADTTEGSQRGAHVTFDAADASGNCGAVTASTASGSFFPVGTTVVTVSSENNGGSCSFTVTVEDQGTNPPTISCPANPPAANANGDCEAAVAVGTATATGNNVTVIGTRSDGKPMYTCDANGTNCVRRSSDDNFSSGVTTITWIARSHDVPGPYANADAEEAHRTGAASCTEKVTVYDTTPPVITAVDSTVSADSSCQAAVPDYTNSVSDNCSCAANDNSQDCVGQHRITVTQSPAAGTLVGIGPHTIHLSANDGASSPGPDGIPDTADDGTGNTTTKDITFTVEDRTAPTIHCPADVTANTAPGTCSAVVDPGTATATDNCDSTPTITGTRSDGQPLNAPYPRGTTTITWRATDDAGNYSECAQTIRVEDHEAPVIVCPANITQGNDPGTCSATVNTGQPTVTDNCDNHPTVTSSRSDGQAMNAPYPKGTTTITWTATDASGNHSSCTQTVTVVDNEKPTFTFTAMQSMWPPNHKYQTFTTANLVASVHDNCDGNIPVSSVVITKVTSDEIENGNGDGNTTNDIVIAANCKSVQLRSEREGDSNGRVYTIFFSVTDMAGNKGTGTTKVVVPHNPGETAVDSGPHYTVTSNCP